MSVIATLRSRLDLMCDADIRKIVEFIDNGYAPPVAEPPGQRGTWPECAPGPWTQHKSRVIYDDNGMSVVIAAANRDDDECARIRDFILSRVNAPAVPPGRAVEHACDCMCSDGAEAQYCTCGTFKRPDAIAIEEDKKR
jgi:hypothetical protein